MFREQYKHLNKQVNPDQDLIEITIEDTQKYEKKKYRVILLALRKPMIAFASFCLCFFLVMPVLADTEPIYRLMYLISPATAQFFKPIKKTDVDNGIKMEVVSAYIHENVAEIYITMEDLTGNRIDETIDLPESYSINRPVSSIGHCSYVGYDAETKKATFLITIQEGEGKDIAGEKITFSVSRFLSHKKTYDDIPFLIDLSTVPNAESTQKVSKRGGGYVAPGDMSAFVDALIPSTPMSEFAVDGIELTGIGYIDGKLHIQTSVKDKSSNDNHGHFYLKDKAGNIINSKGGFDFIKYDDQENRIDYHNDVFDIPQDEISNYTLSGYFVISGMETKGNWKVTFPLEEADSAN